MATRRYGSDLIVDLLHRYGIRYAPLNPGSTFRGLHDSIVNYGGNRPEIIECPHEEIAVAMAHGYAKVTGEPLVAILHNVVGLLHGAMAIYYAYLDRVPMLIMGATGPMDAALRRPRIDWDHTALVQADPIRHYVKWDDQPFGPEAVVEGFVRGYRIACAEPQGPVYFCYDVAFQEEPLTREVPLPDPQRPRVYTPLQADAAALDRAAAWLTEAERPVLVADLLGRRPERVTTLVELAELLAAPVVDMNGRLNFPTRHPLCSLTREPLRQADVVLLLDVRDPFGALTEPAPESARGAAGEIRHLRRVTPAGCRVIELGIGDLAIRSWSHQFQRLLQTDLPILGDTQVALPALLEACRQRVKAGRLPASASAAAREARLAEWRRRHEAARRRWEEEARANWDAQPMTTARLASEVWRAIRGRDWVLTANTLGNWTRRLWDFDQPYRHPGRHLGTATQIGISLGVALAYRGSGKLVVDIQPDGDLMFDVGALWVATHHQIPILVVMYNNRAYYNDWEHQIVVARERGRDERTAYIGMELDHPAPDFAALARAFGWYAEGPITDGSQVYPALERAIRVLESEGRPALVDCVTQFR
ncbi:MAG TPA: thiamine pyrophosphate-binding protein [Thermodesulfobacteriota bacterium]|nr:thiamine pyrophosphate-binding protein [Thermodesulfobacteriota bacterium]